MPVSKARKKSHKNGQSRGAGRFALSSQDVALRLIGRAALILSICVLASSTVSDPLQRLADEALRTGAADMASARQQERLALLRRTARDPDGVRHLSSRELELVFGTPTLRREEPEAVSWHFTSAECALDVYFPRREDTLAAHPVYAEYRVRGEAMEGGLKEASPLTLDHRACVKSLFSHAKFLDVAG